MDHYCSSWETRNRSVNFFLLFFLNIPNYSFNFFFQLICFAWPFSWSVLFSISPPMLFLICSLHLPALPSFSLSWLTKVVLEVRSLVDRRRVYREENDCKLPPFCSVASQPFSRENGFFLFCFSSLNQGNGRRCIHFVIVFSTPLFFVLFFPPHPCALCCDVHYSL